MPSKNITSVTWSCGDLPAGVNFDTATGTFSGTPEEDGEYVVPVTVETNYGTDTKDVKLIVSVPEPEIPEEYGAVYAIGTRAATWSGNAEADAEGWRKLNMPDACRLVRTYKGFAAKTGDGEWYVCGKDSGTNPVRVYGIADFNPSTPERFPVDNIVDMSFGERITSGDDYYYFAYLTRSRSAYILTKVNSIGVNPLVQQDDVRLLSKNYGYGVGTLLNSGEIYLTIGKTYYTLAEGVTPSQVKTLLAKVRLATPSVTYLTKSGELYEGAEHVEFSGGPIREIWGGSGSDIIYAVTQDNKLYARGWNNNYQLGFTTTSYRNTFELVGEYDVKKISPNATGGIAYLLTTDGKLYHTGLAQSGIVAQHKGFTQIFPDKQFIDITVYGTLVAIVKE